MASRSISREREAFIPFFRDVPSTSRESDFSVNDVNEPIEPRIDFVNEFVFAIDFDRVTTITTSARGA